MAVHSGRMPNRETFERWLVCTDTGGTFTDCLARDPSGRLHRAKVLSTSSLRGKVSRILNRNQIGIDQQWGACDDLVAGFEMRRVNSGAALGMIRAFDSRDSILTLEHAIRESQSGGLEGALVDVACPEPAPILAARLVTSTPYGRPLPSLDLRLATTRGTNALLERRGAEVAFFVTRGFGDLLRIGDQTRPDIFAIRIVRPPPLHQHVVEVAERLNADGSVLELLDETAVEAAARRLHDLGVRSAAVALMHAHRNPSHEQRVSDILRRCGFEYVATSSDIAPLMRIVPRAQTAVVDAYLGPVVGSYLAEVERALKFDDSSKQDGDQRVHVMTSAGALNRSDRFRACESLLSGPAGGVLGAAAAGRASGFKSVIGFDMGGTSTDVCRFSDGFHYRFEHAVGDARLLAPAFAIETVAAGGGSICDFRDGSLVVGPHSAGADPGPACYGTGGPLTITDVNLMLGRLSEDQFEIPISKAESQRAFEALLSRMAEQRQQPTQQTELLEALLELANQRMASAIEQVSLRRGHDVRESALVAFGGAGGQHACAMASRLGMTTVIMPADASLLSAAGLLTASIERIVQKQVLRVLDDCGGRLQKLIREASAEAISQVEAEGVGRDLVQVRRVMIHARLRGQDSTIQIDVEPDEPDLSNAVGVQFVDRYRRIHGHEPPLDRKPIEIESLGVLAGAYQGEHAAPWARECQHNDVPHTTHEMCVHGEWLEVRSWNRDALTEDMEIKGPAIVVDRRSSYCIDSGWMARLHSSGAIIAHRQTENADQDLQNATSPDIVQRELFTHRFMAIATDMGQLLQRTSLSTNIKERLDFSCTVLDAQGTLIANAPHLPVHLGAMGECVRAVRNTIELRPGDVIITNHPAFGGSHLPDVTLITPVFSDDALVGYVANRAHHAELGGTRPGSMPPDARTLAEEGVVIPPTILMRDGRPRWDEIESMLRKARWPSRMPDDNLADLHAQMAANLHGARVLQALTDVHGVTQVQNMMSMVSDHAAAVARKAFSRLPQKVLSAIELLDDGTEIRVQIDPTVRPMIVDFAGTGAQHPRNLNATPAIVRSAVMYVLRLLAGESLPLNEGLMREVEIKVPRDSILNPSFDINEPQRCPAVVGGNTEVSQRLVDALLKAVGCCACSQGTMNNVLFGDGTLGYYETVCGGSGGTAEGPGQDAVHVHMTNTRITDPEVLEHRYPVRLDRFAIRTGSGGAGRHRGGDGTIRELTFLRPMALSVLSQHRVQRPYGIDGGSPGQVGSQHVERANGDRIELDAIDRCDMNKGDRFILLTPGGGGWGSTR